MKKYKVNVNGSVYEVEIELIDGLEELLAHGYIRYQDNAYILQEVM